MTIKTFIFNPFQLNTYVVYDETKSAVIIDAGNSNEAENTQLFDFISQNDLKVEGLYYTHAHVDHIVGNNAIINKYDIKSYANPKSKLFFEQVEGQASSLGFSITNLVIPELTLEEGNQVKFGNSTFEIVYTPGHADGSICFYSQQDEFIIVGDVLFRDSIGRTDLPTGDFDLLKMNIINKLYSLPSTTKVFPGHGPSTSIGYEKSNNPFVNISDHV